MIRKEPHPNRQRACTSVSLAHPFSRPLRCALSTQLELQAMINEKKAELERLNSQHESLQRVEADQKALIEKLTNNEA